MPTHVKMSPAALARCRSMVITHLEDGVRHKLEIFDPKLGGKSTAAQIVRTTQDLVRFRSAWIKTFSVPLENVSEVDKTLAAVTEDANADRPDKNSSEVHEHRGEVLGVGAGGSKPEPRKVATFVSKQT